MAQGARSSQLVQRGAVLLGTRIASAGLQSVTLALVAGIGGARNFGYFATVLSVGAVFSALTGFGFNNRALRLSMESDAEAIRAAMTIVRIIGCFLSTLSVIAIFSVIGGTPSSILWAASVYTAAELIAELSQSILLGSHRTLRTAIILLLRRVVPLVVICLFLALHINQYIGVFTGSAIVIPLALLIQGSLRYRPANIKTVLTGSIHYWSQALWSSAQQLDVLIVRSLAGPTAAGVYSAAARLLNPLGLVATSLMSVLVPAMAKETNLDHRAMLYRRARRAIWIYSLAILASSPFIALLIPTFLGGDYTKGRLIFAAFAVGAAMNTASQIRTAGLYVEGRARAVARATMFGTIFGLAVLLIASAFARIQVNLLSLYPIALFAATLAVLEFGSKALDSMRRANFLWFTEG